MKTNFEYDHLSNESRIMILGGEEKIIYPSELFFFFPYFPLYNSFPAS